MIMSYISRILVIVTTIVIILFFIIMYGVKTYDYLDKIYVPMEYNYVLEKIVIINQNGDEEFVDYFQPHKRAEFDEFREYKAQLGQESINIQFKRDADLNFYISTNNHSLFDNLKLDDIFITYNNEIINTYRLVDFNDDYLKLSINDTYLRFTKVDNEFIAQQTGKLILIIPLSTGDSLKIQLDLNKYRTFKYMSKGPFKKPENFLEKMALRWLVGIDYDESKIERNLTFLFY